MPSSVEVSEAKDMLMCRTMVALPVLPFITDAGAVTTSGASLRPSSKAVAVCLFILLIWSTGTVFVQAAWALQSFQIGIYVLLGVYMLNGLRRGREHLAQWWPAYLVYLIPLWGMVQIVTHTTSSTFETRAAVLKWGALVGVFFLTQTVSRTRNDRRNILSAFLIFATCIAILCLTQMFTSQGRVLWLFDSGYPDVYATFPSYNNYAQFIELALPIALWRALREGWRSWWYVLSGGILYGSVIGSASRAGASLCTAEVLLMMLIGLVKLRDPETGSHRRSTLSMVLIVPALAAAFTISVGWDQVWHRFQQNDPYLVRKEFMLAAVDMVRQRPLTGYGLGTFPAVYQRYAVKDFPFYANHTHNDWAEFAADGGIPFLLLVLIPFAAAIPAVMRNPWALGIAVIMLHACVDFPFPRPAVSAWIFLMLAVLYMSETPEPLATKKAAFSASRNS
jgi:O-antigen ligase